MLRNRPTLPYVYPRISISRCMCMHDMRGFRGDFMAVEPYVIGLYPAEQYNHSAHKMSLEHFLLYCITKRGRCFSLVQSKCTPKGIFALLNILKSVFRNIPAAEYSLLGRSRTMALRGGCRFIKNPFSNEKLYYFIHMYIEIIL